MNRSILFLFFLLASCSKEQSASQADIDRAATTKAWLRGKSLRLSDFHASAPVDYLPGDIYGPETDLNHYRPAYLYDDSAVFSASGVVTYQNQVKSPQIAQDSFTDPWDVQADSKGVIVTYLNFDYSPLKYYLDNYTDSTLTMYVNRGDVRLVSVFKILK